MPRPTNTERIDDIARQVVILTRDVEHVTALLRDQGADLQKLTATVHDQSRQLEVLGLRITQIEKFDPSQIPLGDRRLTHVEKLLDETRLTRRQVYLAFLAAALSATVALVVAFVRRP
jgi:hypothetical protein